MNMYVYVCEQAVLFARLSVHIISEQRVSLRRTTTHTCCQSVSRALASAFALSNLITRMHTTFDVGQIGARLSRAT
jgi:hypothetical protein